MAQPRDVPNRATGTGSATGSTAVGPAASPPRSGHGISVHHTGSPDDAARPHDRKEATARQKEQYGGIKIGSAFFGWLTATGTALLLTALLAAAGTAVGVTTNTSVTDAV